MKSSRYQVFIDFDNTITSFDVLDEIIKKFSANDHWKKLERQWQVGNIGSRTCLAGQIKGVRIQKKELLRYLAFIKVDPYFSRLLMFLKKQKTRAYIVSDSFSFIIKAILKNNNIPSLSICANTLKFAKDRLYPSFPHRNRTCDRCAHCKKNTLLNKLKNDKIHIYIGDGLSDACAAESTQLVFAKGKLLKHFHRMKKPCVVFRNLKDVYTYFREELP
jgi:2-hydroxy-3-keto-5-methylthiopentenyl-1-phosphate phosphatase